jgi:hypothetical protein
LLKYGTKVIPNDLKKGFGEGVGRETEVAVEVGALSLSLYESARLTRANLNIEGACNDPLLIIISDFPLCRNHYALKVFYGEEML